MRRRLAALATRGLLSVVFSCFSTLICGQAAFAEKQSVPLFPSASNALQQGFVRIVNRSDASGEVAIHAIDDSGRRFGPVAFVLNARATKHFNSQDLEMGSPDKGITSGIGGGQGDWRLEIESDLDIEALAYIRTADGFLTSMHDVVVDADSVWRVPIFNPASNLDQASRLRLVNPNAVDAVLTLTGLDDAGAEPAGGEISIRIPAGEVRTVTAQQLEFGDGDFAGQFGDGGGKWQLIVSATAPIQAMSLLESPTGHLTNLSTAAAEGLARRNEGASSTTHAVPLFMSASNPQLQGFVRIINHSDEPGEVAIHAIDDSGRRFGPVTFMLNAKAAKHVNSDDLEMGNADKGLSTGTGGGYGNWRLEVESSLDIEALAYVRTLDGFLTAMHDVVSEDEGIHRAPTFNPGSNLKQKSVLRLINPNAEDAQVRVMGLDDAGERSASGALCIEIPAGAANTVSAQQMESGDDAFDGRLGDGAGKWQLYFSSTVPILAMSLLESPTGHLTNLSTTAADGRPDLAEALTRGMDCATGAEGDRVEVPDVNLRNALARALGKAEGAPILAQELATLRTLELRSEVIRNLDGLQFATNLTSLDVRGNPIDDVSELSNLSALASLDLSFTHMTDLSSLSGLTKLTKLSLSNNYIVDISPLSSLTALVELDLSLNQIVDITPLSNLTRLKTLNLGRNNLYDYKRRQDFLSSTYHGSRGLKPGYFSLTPLANLTRLERLNLSGNGALDQDSHVYGNAPLAHMSNDVDVLSNLRSLVELDLSGGNLYNLSFLSGLTRLRTLDLSGSYRLQNLTPLAGLTALRVLKLNSTDITDLAPISALTDLEVLELKWISDLENLQPLSSLTALTQLIVRTLSGVQQLSPLSSLTNLEILELAVNPSGDCARRSDSLNCDISQLSLSGMTELTTLHLRGIKASDLSSLSQLTKLTSLTIIGNQSPILDLAPLLNLQKLKLLHISLSVIRNVDALGGLKALETLRLNGVVVVEGRRRLNDLSPLSGLTGLRTLELTENEITDISPLSGLTGLTELNLSENEIVDISPLSGLTGLLTLNLNYNCNIEDLSPLLDNPALGQYSNVATPGLRDDCRRSTEERPIWDLLQERQGRRDPFAEVTFPDLVLRSIVEGHLGKKPGERILRHEMATLRSLIFNQRQEGSRYQAGDNLHYGDFGGHPIAVVEHLHGLRFAINLEELEANQGEFHLRTFAGEQLQFLKFGHPMDDLGALRKLTKLTLRKSWLGRQTERARQAMNTALSHLRRLTTLDISGNHLKNDTLRSLSGLTALTHLSIGGNNVSDLSPLSELTELRHLDASFSGYQDRVTDVSALSGLTKLKVLGLAGQLIVDLSPLSGLTALTALYLQGQRDPGTVGANARSLEDLSPLAGLTSLQTLDVSGNRTLTDLSPLSGLSKLKTLNLDRTKIADLASLTELRELRTLDLGTIIVPDWSPLAGLSKLVKLSHFFTAHGYTEAGVEIPDMSPIWQLTTLQDLEISALLFESPLSISGLPDLERLSLTIGGGSGDGSVVEVNLPALRTFIFKSAPKAAFELRMTAAPELTTLDIGVGAFRGLELPGLSGLPKLESLTLRSPHSVNLSFLSGLQRLRTLDVDRGWNISGFDAISSLRSLETLRLEVDIDSIRTGGGLGFLSDLTNLRKLNFPGVPGGHDLPSLDRLQRLEEISLGALDEAGIGTSDGSCGEYHRIPPSSHSSLANLRNLKVLRACLGGDGGDVSFLSGLSSLEDLSIDLCCDYTDLSPLSELSSLRRLVLVGLYPSTDLSPLYGLPKLEVLNIGGRRPTVGRAYLDDVVLSDLPALKYLANSRAKNRFQLSNLPKLQEVVGIGGSVVSLSNLPAVRDIDVMLIAADGSERGISFGDPSTYRALVSLDISSNIGGAELGAGSQLSISDFPALRRFYMGRNHYFTDISIANLPRLESIEKNRRSWSRATEIAISNLPSLIGLDWRGSDLSSLSLHDVPELSSLNLSYNELVGGSALSLSNVPSLKILGLGYNDINDLSFVSGLHALERLILNDNGTVVDLSPLAGLSRLRVLNFHGNMVRDLGPLRNMHSLGEIDMSANEVEDLSPLVENTGFSVNDLLYYGGNPLSDESLNTHLPALRARGVRTRRFR